MLAIDTETTGVDLYHGARPFFVSTCDDKGVVKYWEWSVDPLTRIPQVPAEDVAEISLLLEEEDVLVFQNSKFDVKALNTVGVKVYRYWDKIVDTLLAGHMLYSGIAHDLTTMAVQYLGVDISNYELNLKHAVIDARRMGKSLGWAIAERTREDMPSAKDTNWRYDYWLPSELIRRGENVEANKIELWERALREYALADAECTLALWQVMSAMIRERKLDKIYRERLKILPIAYKMENRGVTASKANLSKLLNQYQEEATKLSNRCVAIAAGYDYELSMPKSGNNKSLRDFVFGAKGLGIAPPDGEKARFDFGNGASKHVFKRSEKTGEPSLDKASLEQLEGVLPPNSKAKIFITALKSIRKMNTAITYMQGYTRYWIDTGIVNERGERLWFRLHPSLNPTGTATLRWSSSNPNEQNISKQEGFNLRYCFGPAPGREWWSLDAKNIELRIPAYLAKEQSMIDLFERPDDAPYYGSNHLLAAHILHPREFEACVGSNGVLDGRIFKKKYASTLYQWTKNGNFAVQYGAIESSGTADRAYHVVGGQRRIQGFFKEINKLNRSTIAFAEKHGYIETVPDKNVDPERGYPLMCARTEYGKILPTTPLNYKIQGTAMWWMAKAMTRTDAKLEEWRSTTGFDGFIAMQVHDELVFDFPAGKVHPKEDKGKFHRSNLWRIRILQKLMEKGGDDIGIPTPVSAEYHKENWSEGETL